MSSLKAIQTFLITIMLLMPFTNKYINENQVVKNNLISIEEKKRIIQIILKKSKIKARKRS